MSFWKLEPFCPGLNMLKFVAFTKVLNTSLMTPILYLFWYQQILATKWFGIGLKRCRRYNRYITPWDIFIRMCSNWNRVWAKPIQFSRGLVISSHKKLLDPKIVHVRVSETILREVGNMTTKYFILTWNDCCSPQLASGELVICNVNPIAVNYPVMTLPKFARIIQASVPGEWTPKTVPRNWVFDLWLVSSSSL